MNARSELFAFFEARRSPAVERWSARLIALVLATLFSCGLGFGAPSKPAVAFHLGPKPPLRVLSNFDWVVLDPRAVRGPSDLEGLGSALPIARFGLEKVEGGALLSSAIEEAWVLGRRRGHLFMDIAAPGYRALLLDELLPALFARGFKGLFFDATRPYLLEAGGPERRRARALKAFLAEVRARFGEVVLLARGGFDALEDLSPFLSAIAAEGLYSTWDKGRGEYVEVREEARRRSLGALDRARALGLLTLAIDYVPARERDEARAIARRIAAEGHVPWVAPSSLEARGVGALEVLPRSVILVYDSSAYEDVAFSPAHRFLALPLEYLGLTPRYLDVRGALPEGQLVGEVSGIVAWLEGHPLEDPQKYRDFLLRHLSEGVPLVLFGTVDGLVLRALGLDRGRSIHPKEVEIVRSSELVGFEAPPRPVAYALSSLYADERGYEPLLELRSEGVRMQPILLAPWGGLALQPFALVDGADGGRWVLDPFEFLKRALKLPSAPIIDPTTENGRRLLVTHIDGDGAPSRAELPGRPLAITVIRRRLEAVAFPHTVSVVEGELSPHGQHPEASPLLEKEARRLFRLPHVEPASHGFSHPFDWSKFEANEPSHLALSGPTPSVEREIGGSLAYASRLAGRPVDLFLWTGNAVPGPESLKVVRALGARQMNGGFTTMTDTDPSVTFVSPRGRPVGDEFQVYAPILNENVYTNGWLGPFWGYRRVIETFDRTGSPRRLVPLGIYYHFFSGTKRASLRALDQVYANALRRSPLPIFASTWVDKVLESRRAAVLRRLDGAYVVDAAREVRTVRAPPELGYVDIDQSVGVLGERRTPVGRFIHLDGRSRAVIGFSQSKVSRPSLVQASARVSKARAGFGRLDITFQGPPPISVVVKGGRCQPSPEAKGDEGDIFLLKKSARLVCRRRTR